MLTPNMRELLAERFTLVDDEFATAVVDGLSRPQKTLPCRFFYDARGSELFEEITALPEYYPTRTETAILQARAAEMAGGMSDAGVLVELGSGSSLKTEILLAELPGSCAYVPIDVSHAALVGATRRLADRFAGLDVRPITPDIARQLNLRGVDGVVVFSVEDDSAAAEAGLQRGDVIREVNRQRVRNVQDFERATKDVKEGDRVTVLLQRGQQSLYVAFTIARG